VSLTDLAPIEKTSPDLIRQSERLLEQAHTLNEVLHVRQIAKAATQYYRAANQARYVVIEAQSLTLKAERRAGEILKLTRESGERATASGNLRIGPKSPEGTSEKPLLADLAITRKQSSLWQRIADVPKKVFEKYVSKPTDHLKDMTATGLLREAKEATRQQWRDANAEMVDKSPTIIATTKGREFSAIVIDPPWDWGDEGDFDQMGRALPQYKTMPFAELRALDIPANDNAHLYLWITNRSLPKGFQLLDDWGFRYVTMLTWVKPSFGMGNYFRGSTEHVLFGVRGSLQLLRRDVGTHFTGARGGKKHSSKPEAFYKLVETCSPGPWLEMFARGQRKGWTSWGAEAIQE